MYARPFIDSLDFAGKRQEISGEVPITELPRLHDILENQQGILSYRIRGGVDNQANHFLDVSVNGRCRARCQRCLKGMDYPIQLDTRLLLRDQAGLDALGEKDDEFDSVLAEVQLDVLKLLEDEILLSLPIAPRHEQGACQLAVGSSRQQDERHPFAALAKLKRN